LIKLTPLEWALNCARPELANDIGVDRRFFAYHGRRQPEAVYARAGLQQGSWMGAERNRLRRSNADDL
jgi:hypothetical protein